MLSRVSLLCRKNTCRCWEPAIRHLCGFLPIDALRKGLNAAEKLPQNMAAVYAQLLYSITATPPGSSAKIHISISLISAISSPRHLVHYTGHSYKTVSPPQNESSSVASQDSSSSHVCYGSVNSSPLNTAARMQPKAIRNRKGSVKGDCWGNKLLT